MSHCNCKEGHTKSQQCFSTRRSAILRYCRCDRLGQYQLPARHTVTNDCMPNTASRICCMASSQDANQHMPATNCEFCVRIHLTISTKPAIAFLVKQPGQQDADQSRRHGLLHDIARQTSHNHTVHIHTYTNCIASPQQKTTQLVRAWEIASAQRYCDPHDSQGRSVFATTDKH
jgi:hypothetical protein